MKYLLVFLLCLSLNSFAATLYGVGREASGSLPPGLNLIDPTIPVASYLGDPQSQGGQIENAGLACDAAAQCYTSGFLSSADNNSLALFDLTTGIATFIAEFAGANTVDGMTFNTMDNKLYGLSFIGGAQSLVTINPNNAVVTLVGSLNVATSVDRISGLAYDAVHNKMYAAGQHNIYEISFTSGGAKSTKANGSAQLIGAHGLNLGNVGLAYDNSTQTLYLSDSNNPKLYTINVNTGIASEIGTGFAGLIFGFSALAIVSGATPILTPIPVLTNKLLILSLMILMVSGVTWFQYAKNKEIQT